MNLRGPALNAELLTPPQDEIAAWNLRQSVIVSFIFPLAYIFPATISRGPLNIAGLAVLLVGLFSMKELIGKMIRGQFVLVVSDVGVLATSGWMLSSSLLHGGLSSLVQSGPFSIIQFFLCYVLCRIFFSNPSSFLAFAERMIYVLLFTLMYACLDVATSKNIVSRIGFAISSGAATQPLAGEAFRFGLVRAQGSFEHPILMGTFFVLSAVLLSQSLLSPIKKVLAVGTCTVGVALALSSAPILSSIQALAIFSYFAICRNFPWAKLLLWAVLVYAVLCVALFVDQPIEALIKSFTLDPQTGFYRMDIWRWVAVNVRLSPWIGIGTAEWVRPSDMSATVDSLWLVESLRYGLPATALLLITCVTTGTTVFQGRSQTSTLDERRMALALGIAIFLMIFSAFSVHFWGFIWLYLAGILGMRAGLTEAIIIRRGTPMRHRQVGYKRPMLKQRFGRKEVFVPS